METVITVIW